MAGVTASAVTQTGQAGADAKVVPEDAKPVQARAGAKKAGARADRPGNYKNLPRGRNHPAPWQHFNNGD